MITPDWEVVRIDVSSRDDRCADDQYPCRLERREKTYQKLPRILHVLDRLQRDNPLELPEHRRFSVEIEALPLDSVVCVLRPCCSQRFLAPINRRHPCSRAGKNPRPIPRSACGIQDPVAGPDPSRRESIPENVLSQGC